MKKHYETPSVEKIQFNYRDQVVAASAGTNNSTDPTTPSNPTIGSLTQDTWGSSCKYYVAEAISWGVCSLV